ncbi:hypothetical protein AGRA3207_007549 [Actinomadura graeca]|uniref:DUF2637 domain-containing protein n=1 Tax=Actinomadura graeca TaxID=2750812 RepID=A0ABX8R882_9ACTN|nr:hypothetical protein [Actinomadura graeca]QXJ25977.1 hypothetical protein AGRA3207_007549 [Actinomadura graeca]
MIDLANAPAPWMLVAAALLLELVLALAGGLVLYRAGRHSERRRGLARAPAAGSRRRAENWLTFAAAALATAVQAQGMWRVFEHRLHMPLELRVLTSAFLEIAVVTCAVRARSNVQDPRIGTAGQDGVAVWALTGASAFAAACDSQSWIEGVVRLIAPLTAAWLWERGLHVQRRHHASQRLAWLRTINWRITPERVLVRLRVAEPADRTAGQVDAHRRLAHLARAARRLRILRHADAARWRQHRAQRHLNKALDRAIEYTGLINDPASKNVLTTMLATMYHAGDLADLAVPGPWLPGPGGGRSTSPRTEPGSADRDAPFLMAVPGHGALAWSTTSPCVRWSQRRAPHRTQTSPGATHPADTGLPAPGLRFGARMAPVPDREAAIQVARNKAAGPPPAPLQPLRAAAPRGGASPAASGQANADTDPGGGLPPAPSASDRHDTGNPRAAARTRRPMPRWVQLAGPIFHRGLHERGRQPTGAEFAAAIADAGLGAVSISTAKNIRAAIRKASSPHSPPAHDVPTASPHLSSSTQVPAFSATAIQQASDEATPIDTTGGRAGLTAIARKSPVSGSDGPA